MTDDEVASALQSLIDDGHTRGPPAHRNLSSEEQAYSAWKSAWRQGIMDNGDRCEEAATRAAFIAGLKAGRDEARVRPGEDFGN